MSIIEAGHYKMSFQVNGLGSGIRKRADFIIVASRQDFFSAHQHGFSPRRSGIVGINASIAINCDRSGGVGDLLGLVRSLRKTNTAIGEYRNQQHRDDCNHSVALAIFQDFSPPIPEAPSSVSKTR